MVDTKKKKLQGNAQTRKIKSVVQFIKALPSYKSKTKALTDNYLYRGLANSDWEIKSTDKIRLGIKSDDRVSSESGELVDRTTEKIYNSSLVQYFKHEFSYKYKDSYILDSDLAVLAQLRHYSTANALIDFSGNPLFALWFACQEHKKEINHDKKFRDNDLYYKKETDGVVYILNINDEEKFTEIHNNKQLKKYSIELIYSQENEKKWFYWKPSHLNKRIPAQSSYFVTGQDALPKGNITKIKISHIHKKDILQELSHIYSIDGATLFPDMHGFAAINKYNSPYNIDAEYRTLIRFYTSEIEIAIANKEDNVIIGDRYIRMGLVKSNIELHKEAIKDFDRGIKLNPKNIIAYSKRGTSKSEIGKSNEAIKDFNKAIKLDSNFFTAYYHRGIEKNKLQKYQESIKDFDKVIIMKPDFLPGYYSRGVIENKLKKYEKAIKDFDKVIKIDPAFFLAYHKRGLIKMELKKHKEAIEYFDRAIEIQSDFIEAYDNRGMAYHELDNHQEVIKNFDTIIKLDNKNFVAYLNRGMAKLKLKQNKEAIKDFDKAITLNPKYSDAYYCRGIMSFELKSYKAAIEDFNKVIHLNSKHSGAYYNRGFAKHKLEKHRKAIEDYDKAAKLDPQNISIYMNRGVAKLKLKQYEEAIADFKKALELDPDDDDTKKLLLEAEKLLKKK